MKPELLERAGALVRERTGLVFPESRRRALADGIAKAMRRAGTRDIEVYLARLASDVTLLDDLVALITIGETYFFRDIDQCRTIEREILPALLSRRPDTPLRIWSAGCATGEEAYTLAILAGGRPIRILATDLSRPALAVARRGRYGRWSLRGVASEVIARHFSPAGDQFEIEPALRSMVEFSYLNLAEDVYPSLATGVWGIDLILCRNVLIYFDAVTVARVARQLLATLTDEGWLLLGAADPPLWQHVECEVVVLSCGIAYRRTAARSAPAPLAPPAPTPSLAVPRPPAPPSTVPVRTSTLGPTPARDPIEPGPIDVQDWISLVRELANAGRLADADRACIRALERHETSPELTYLHAMLLGEAGARREAAAAARRALYLDRTFVVAHLALGAALTRLGDRPGARRAFRNAEQLLAALPLDQPVPGADGEPAGRLAAMARAQRELLGDAAA